MRAPQLGAVKSRLARDTGTLGAWKFYRDATRSLVRHVRDDRIWQTWLAITPQRFVDHPVWPRGVARIDQGMGDIGARMARPFIDLPSGPVVMIGSDIPEIRRRHVARAFAALDRAEVVLGPAHDGGFWLVGLRRRPRAPTQLLKSMFSEVRWSTTHALADVVKNISGHATIKFVDTLHDIDTGADLHEWRQATRG